MRAVPPSIQWEAVFSVLLPPRQVLTMKTTAELLAEHAELMNRYGAWSRAERDFVDSHCENAEFVELAYIARRLKEALTAKSE